MISMWNEGIHVYIDGLVQERCNSSASAVELSLSCTKPSTCLYHTVFMCCPQVLAQQRAEQARLQASTNPPIAPDAPVDPAGFISSLPTSLRQQVLADMDDSLVAVLPADLAAEAQGLRRELEERHRRLMHDRLFQGAASLSAILRQSG